MGSQATTTFQEDGESFENKPQPILRRTLHDELLDRLRELIVQGELAPGSKVPEKELCEHFGVSRTPMREALKVLASEGLIVLTPNRGAMVSKLTLSDLEEAFPIMGALEALSGEMACKHISDEEIAEIRKLHQKMVAHYEAGKLSSYFELNQQIHEKILASARNRTLSALHRSLSGKVRRARYMANLSNTRWRNAVEEHKAILNALENRDGDRLAAILKAHLANKFEALKKGLLSQEA